MIDLYVEYNPFILNTVFLVNGIEPEANSQFAEFKAQRMQYWVDNFFEELYRIFNQAKKYKITFKGLEEDFEDFKYAVDEANENGFYIELKHEASEGVADRLIRALELVKEAKKSPVLKKYFTKSDNEINENLFYALEEEFDVYVIATMSSGKSTFINSMLGVELLPALNQATTATIAKIYLDKQKQHGEFVLNRTDHSGKMLDKGLEVNFLERSIDEKVKKISEWNEDENTTQITIFGNLIGIQDNPNIRVVLTDTPGPNNSQNANHAITTMGYIKDTKRNPIIIYVLNATQLGINDDQGLLREISEIMAQGGKQSRDRFIFILNKADVFDVGKGESISGAIENARRYLQNNGIEYPRIYPVSSLLAALLRKRDLNSSLLTRSERRNLLMLEEEFEEEDFMDLTQYMRLGAGEKNLLAQHIRESKYSKGLVRSGIPAIEAVIEQYMDKYTLPHRVSRAYNALQKVIEKGTDKAHFLESLDLATKELDLIRERLQKLEETIEESYGIQLFINRLESQEVALPDSLVNEVKKRQNKVSNEINNFGDRLSNKLLSESQAEKAVQVLEVNLNQQIASFIVDLTSLSEQALSSVKGNIIGQYKDHIEQLFNTILGESRDIEDLSVFHGLRSELSTLGENAFKLSLESSDIEKVVSDKERREIISKTWYKPWTWFGSGIRTYREKVTEEKVDMHKFWHSRYIEITMYINEMFQKMVEETETQSGRLMREFAEYIEKEFDKAFNKLTKDLERQLSDKALREKTIREAKEQIAYIEKFEAKMQDIIAV